MDAVEKVIREMRDNYKKMDEVSEPQMFGAEKSSSTKNRKAKEEFTVITKKVTGTTPRGRTSKRTRYYCSGGNPCTTSKHKKTYKFHGSNMRSKVEDHIKSQHLGEETSSQFTSGLAEL